MESVSRSSNVVEREPVPWEDLRDKAVAKVESLIPNSDFAVLPYEELQSVAAILREELLKCEDNSQRFYAERLAKVLHVAENYLQIKELEDPSVVLKMKGEQVGMTVH
jgi:hypothetical protein